MKETAIYVNILKTNVHQWHYALANAKLKGASVVTVPATQRTRKTFAGSTASPIQMGLLFAGLFTSKLTVVTFVVGSRIYISKSCVAVAHTNGSDYVFRDVT